MDVVSVSSGKLKQESDRITDQSYRINQSDRNTQIKLQNE